MQQHQHHLRLQQCRNSMQKLWPSHRHHRIHTPTRTHIKNPTNQPPHIHQPRNRQRNRKPPTHRTKRSLRHTTHHPTTPTPPNTTSTSHHLHTQTTTQNKTTKTTTTKQPQQQNKTKQKQTNSHCHMARNKTFKLPPNHRRIHQKTPTPIWNHKPHENRKTNNPLHKKHKPHPTHQPSNQPHKQNHRQPHKQPHHRPNIRKPNQHLRHPNHPQKPKHHNQPTHQHGRSSNPIRRRQTTRKTPTPKHPSKNSPHRNLQHNHPRKNRQTPRTPTTQKPRRHQIHQLPTKGTTHMLTLKPDQIKPNIWNCNFLSQDEKQNLKQNLQKNGPQKTPPIIVRKTQTNNYEIVDGEHRWQIAKELGWTTINTIEQQATDQQSKALSISYNRWRGHLNWIKLYTIIKQDKQTGINIQETYKNALTPTELEWLLTLDKLTPNTLTTLEEALKKHPEITLEQLHLLTLFPTDQQQNIVEKFKKPMVTQALTQALNDYTQKTPQQPNTKPQTQTNNYHYYTPTQNNHPNTNTYTQHNTPNHQEEEKTNQNTQTNQTNQNTTNQNTTKNTTPALLTTISYNCKCGKHYHIDLKNATVKVQKENQLFEYIDTQPHTLQVHCNKCKTDHEFTIKNTQKETLQILCTRCKPQPRKGTLNINTGEATWID